MTVTELLTRNAPTTISATPDLEGSFTFPLGLGIGDPFLDGVHLHAGLRLLSKPNPYLSPRSKRLWPILAAIRTAARALGAERIAPEVAVSRGGLTGRVDLRADGKMGPGHIEVKVVAALPDAPRQRDLRQMTLYLSLSGSRMSSWTALIYVCMAEGRASSFVFSDSISALMASGTALRSN